MGPLCSSPRPRTLPGCPWPNMAAHGCTWLHIPRCRPPLLPACRVAMWQAAGTSKDQEIPLAATRYLELTWLHPAPLPNPPFCRVAMWQAAGKGEAQETPLAEAAYGQNVVIGMISTLIQNWSYSVALAPGAGTDKVLYLHACV